jgi:hypothetical protein
MASAGSLPLPQKKLCTKAFTAKDWATLLRTPGNDRSIVLHILLSSFRFEAASRHGEDLVFYETVKTA